MAVTKRIRFEVLRRDNYTCRYCRTRNNELTVDHVVAKALGGTDLPDNLVAACKDCNAGKSSATADASLVADVREDALRHAEMIKQTYAVLVQRLGKRDTYLEEFEEGYRGTLPFDWESTLGRWFELGVPIELVNDAAVQAHRKVGSMTSFGRFKYMCAIVWRQAHAVDDTVALKADLLGAFMSEEDRENEDYDTFHRGWDSGRKRGHDEGFAAARRVWETHDFITMQLHNVVEKSFPRQAAHYRGEFDDSLAMITTGTIPTMDPDPWAVAADF